MTRKPNRWPVWIAALVALAAAGTWWFLRSADPPPIPRPAGGLSDLAEPPDWSQLDAFHGSISSDRLKALLESPFTMSDRWREFIKIDDDTARIATGSNQPFVLQLAPPGQAATEAPRNWRPAGKLPPAPPERPLQGLHVAIDPGHLGGAWAKMEERWFQVGDAKPVTEGDLTLKVALLLKPRLERLGAKVSMVRGSTDPLTEWRPEKFLESGHLTRPAGASEGEFARLAEKLFYRTAEIHARARKVNVDLQPDLVLCLHFNAEAWGIPGRPSLVDRNHFHMLVNGAYTDDEVALADQRFEMLHRLLQGTHAEEAAVAETTALVFAEHTGLPAYQYEEDSRRARKVGSSSYVWARNLLANRLYHCPTLFFEPYVMNCREVHARVQAGDYPGSRKVAGAMRPSIFREYADAVAEGLATYYGEHRR